MATISSAGLGSGLDVNSLVTSLVNAEGQPATLRLNKQEAGLQAKVSAVGILKSALSEFQSSVGGLADVSAFRSIAANSGDSSVFTASAEAGAATGSHSVKVANLAQAQKLASKSFASSTEALGTGTLTFVFGTTDWGANTFNPNPGASAKSVTIDSSNNTLEGVRDAVNKAEIGVTASIVDDGTGKRIVFSSDESGVANSLKITVGGDSGGTDSDDLGLSQLAHDPTAAVGAGRNLIETVAAKNANLEVDGLSITRPNNSISGVIDGVTIDLKREAPGTSVSLSVVADGDVLASKVKGFVASYNKLQGTLNNLTRFDAKTGDKGELLGDATLRSVETQIRRVITAPVDGLTGPYQSLASIGIRTQDDGTLKLDSATLQKAVDADRSAVERIFAVSTGDSGEVKGVASKLDDVLKGAVGSTGPISARIEGLNSQISRLDDQRETLSRRLTDLEKRYRLQFTALDTLLTQLQSTGAFLTQQLASLPGSSDNN
jgi:flagellar hook-associated protein 2